MSVRISIPDALARPMYHRLAESLDPCDRDDPAMLELFMLLDKLFDAAERVRGRDVASSGEDVSP